MSKPCRTSQELSLGMDTIAAYMRPVPWPLSLDTLSIINRVLISWVFGINQTFEIRWWPASVCSFKVYKYAAMGSL